LCVTVLCGVPPITGGGEIERTNIQRQCCWKKKKLKMYSEGEKSVKTKCKGQKYQAKADDNSLLFFIFFMNLKTECHRRCYYTGVSCSATTGCGAL